MNLKNSIPRTLHTLALVVTIVGCGNDVRSQEKIPTEQDQIQAIQNNPNLSEESKSRAVAAVHESAIVSRRMSRQTQKPAGQ